MLKEKMLDAIDIDDLVLVSGNDVNTGEYVPSLCIFDCLDRDDELLVISVTNGVTYTVNIDDISAVYKCSKEFENARNTHVNENTNKTKVNHTDYKEWCDW